MVKKHYTLDPRYNALQYNADLVITQLMSWIPIFQGLIKAGPLSWWTQR